MYPISIPRIAIKYLLCVLFLMIFPASNCIAENQQRIQKWDYLVLKLNIDPSLKTETSNKSLLTSKDGLVTISTATPYKKLDEYGAMGWELVGFEGMTFIFKRPK